MSGKTRDSASGMSLIEFMIGVGILSLIAYAASHFFSRVTQSDAEISAKAKAQNELAALSSLLEKDLKFREMNSLNDLCPAGLCTEISIDRLAPNGGSFQVKYSSSCIQMPAGTLYSNLAFDKVTSQCIKALNCPAGSYPSLAIDVPAPPPGVQLPLYPKATPVHGQKRMAYNLVGAAICANKTKIQNVATPTPHTISQDRIILEGAFLGSNNMIRVERKETVISSNNMAKIQMLPN